MACSRQPGTGPDAQGVTVNNWSEQVVFTPAHYFNPSTVDQIVAIVKAAEADRGSRVRVVGSRWSFTDIIETPDYLVQTSAMPAPAGGGEGGINRILSETITSNSTNPLNPSPPQPRSYPNDPAFAAFTSDAKNLNLVHIEAGITIKELHDWLDPPPGQPPNNLTPGVMAGDGPHGWAIPTMGGSGGQTVMGAISTGTHGGDVHLPPLADMVRAIHLVGAGGIEWWIEPSSSRPVPSPAGGPHVVDPKQLELSMPCVAGRIVFDDDLFNSVLVACGRMGIVYSLVIEVVPQFFLKEVRNQRRWNELRSSGDLDRLRNSPDQDPRFLQVLIVPYGTNGDHDCFVTTRSLIYSRQYEGSKNAGSSAFDPCGDFAEDVLVSAAVTAALLSAIAAALAIPIYGIWLSGQIVQLSINFNNVLLTGGTVADALSQLIDGAASIGFGPITDLTATAINTILGMEQSDETDREDVSYAIMDTYQYQKQCFKAVSVEVAFDADGNDYFAYIDEVFRVIDSMRGNNQMVGAYISLRYCGQSRALLAMEQWTHTVCIEIAGISDLQFDASAIAEFEAIAARHGANVHWGQINARNFLDTERTYPRIEIWRDALRRLTTRAPTLTFDNDFCYRRGLEIDGPTTLPQLQQLIAIDGNDGYLQVIGLTRDGVPYLVSWQSSDGSWHLAEPLPFAGGPYTFLATANGNDDFVQLLGVGQADALTWLASWQDQSGQWAAAGILPSQTKRVSQIVLARGNDDFLQVIGLGADDGLAYFLAWQDQNGTWHWGGPSPRLGPPIPYSQLVIARGNSNYLQLIGLGAADGLPYLAAWQDQNGTWQSNGARLSMGPRFKQLVVNNGNDNFLQLLGLGAADGLPYLSNWQDQDGHWHPGSPIPRQTVPFSKLLLAHGNSGYLQLVGLGGNDNFPYLSAWQDGSGTWNPVVVPLSQGVPFSQLVAGRGNGGRLQILGLGQKDQRAYLVTWQETDGSWHPLNVLLP